MANPVTASALRSVLIGVAALAAVPTRASATVLHVPRDVASLDRAIAASAPGDRISVAAGTFPVGSAVQHDLTIHGHRGTVLIAVDESTPHLTVAEAAHLILRTLMLTGAPRAQGSIIGLGGSMDASHVDIVNGYRGVSGSFQDLVMRHGSISQVQWDAIALADPNQVTLADMIFALADNAGIFINESDDLWSDPSVTILKSKITGNQGPGIYFIGPYTHLYVTHTTIDSNGIAGIFLNNPGGVDLQSDEITHSIPVQGQFGDGLVAITFTPQCLGLVSIDGCNIHDNGRSGMTNFSSCFEIANDVLGPNAAFNIEAESQPGGPSSIMKTGTVTCPPAASCLVVTANIGPPTPLPPP